uniref:Uncharacterized protein n=1 Tax=Solanum lycopersicum TaxID=4081 RepID=A0A3Q7GS15_SOLLC
MFGPIREPTQHTIPMFVFFMRPERKSGNTQRTTAKLTPSAKSSQKPGKRAATLTATEQAAK